MKNKKWFVTLIITLLISAFIIGGFNYIIDPFGIFGDQLLGWHSYNMVNNPRIAKIAYLDQHYENYNSYIIGGSKSSSISPELLNKYYDHASFYSMMMYGGDFYDYEKTLYYLVENYHVENIVIHMSMRELYNYDETDWTINNELSPKVAGKSLLKSYARFLTLNLKYSFEKIEGLFRRQLDPFEYSQIIPESGVFNKTKRDAEEIGTYEEFMEKYPEFHQDLQKVSSIFVEENIEALTRMKKYCEDKGISFQFITAPTYHKEMDIYKTEDVIRFWKELAQVTDFWDFTGYTSISYDARNFYDPVHYRNHIGEMMLSRIFDPHATDIPEDFGHYTTKENVDEYLKKSYPDYPAVVDRLNQNQPPQRVPILMYHHLDPLTTTFSDVVVSPKKFKGDMISLKEAGYNTILFKDLVSYVEDHKPLPPKPILITFDDGYLSNYEYAYPILTELDMKATISVIGWSVGQTKYKNTTRDILPHFTWEQAKEMVDSGVMDIQNHSYDMHEPNDTEYPFRKGVMQKKDEGINQYINFFKEDIGMLEGQIEANVENEVTTFAYPYGINSPLSEKLLKDLGYKVTLTVDEGMNLITKDKKSLFRLKRYNINNELSSEELLEMLNQ